MATDTVPCYHRTMAGGCHDEAKPVSARNDKSQYAPPLNCYALDKNATGASWINGLRARRPVRLVSVAVANKTARIAWAV